MSLATHYVCDDCRLEFSLDSPVMLCRECGGLLETHYDLSRAGSELAARAAAAQGRGIWRWGTLLPGNGSISLGEGDTPLLPVYQLAARLRIPGMLVKNDAMMPTGSFKDRGFSVAVSVAYELGIRRAFTYSSGNAGASFAAYAARAGIDATVLVEESANETKVAAISLSGARVVRLQYGSSVDIFGSVAALAQAGRYSFVNFINPVRHEGMKTYAYEICEALDWDPPDVMVHPVGTGGGLVGAWKGFRELYELGLIDRLPRMVGVQPEASAPVVQAFAAGAQRAGRHGDATRTVAQSIAGDAPIGGGTRVLQAIYGSGGRAVAVSDAELFEAMRLLGAEGVSAEPSAATPIAALRRARAEGWVRESDVVVAVVTGSALKQPSALCQAAAPPCGSVPAEPAKLLALVGTDQTRGF
jgi:threonine synthase